jgi:hypothetical protein
MNICTNCGHSVASDRQSCDRCGAALAGSGAGAATFGAPDETRRFDAPTPPSTGHPQPTSPPVPPQPQWQPAAPPPAGGATASWSQPGAPAHQPPSIASQIETSPGEFGQPPSKKPKRGLMIALLAVGALIIAAVAVLAVRSFSGSDRGEANPDDAVNAMFTSIADENPVDLVNAIAPSELAFFGDVERAAADAVDGEGEAADSLEEQGITINGEDIVPGLTLEIDDLTYDVEEKSDDVAKVHVDSISGNWTFDPTVLLESVNLDELTNGQVTEAEALEEIGESEVSSGSFDLDDLDVTDEGVFFMAVREDGGWFVSPLYTLLEYATQINELAEGDFTAPDVEGAATPEEAIERSARGVFSFALEGDFDALLETLPPSRYAALYAYRDALEELATREGIDDADKLDIDVQVDQITEFDDERGTGVTIERASIEMTAEGEDGEITYAIDGACATYARTEFESDDENSEFCLDDLGEDAGPFEDGIPGIDRFWVIVTEDDGEFFVDPVASIGSYLAAADMQEIADDLSEMITPADDVDDTDSRTEPADTTDPTDSTDSTDTTGGG